MHILYKGDLMTKKIFSIIFSIFIVSFSFYYTNKITKILKENDPIMIEIKKYSSEFPDTRVDSILEDNNIIPGIKGVKVDIDTSYSNMKKVGKFDKTLLVFEETKPKNEIKNNYKNYIISLNKKENNVSLIFEITDTSYIEEILSILNNKNVNATFFVSKEIIDNSIDIVKLILNYGNDVELLSDNYSVYEVNKYTSIIKLISNDRLKFCLNINKDDNLLKSCETSKLYTIVPSIIQKNNLYNSLKYNLENGSIILLTNNKIITKELSSSINYIEQKGKKIVLLKNIIDN